MSIKKFIAFCILILDVAAFPYQCNSTRVDNRPCSVIGNAIVYDEDSNTFCDITYINEKGQTKNISRIFNRTLLKLNNFYVTTRNDFDDVIKVEDYENVIIENNENPRIREFQIVGWLVLNNEYDENIYNIDNIVQLPYEYSENDFLSYYERYRNVIVLEPVLIEK